MNQRYFPPSKSMLSEPSRKETRPHESQRSNEMGKEEKRRGGSTSQQQPSSSVKSHRHRRSEERYDEDSMRGNDRKRPKVEKKVFNELEHPHAPPPAASNDNDVIIEAHRYLDVDVFAVEPEKLPLLLTSMLEVERSLDKVVARKMDIREKMVKMYEQESADTRFCLAELEKVIDGVPVGVPGAAPIEQRQWLQDARTAFLQIGFPHKNIAKTIPDGPVPGFSVPHRDKHLEKKLEFGDTTLSTPDRSQSQAISRGSPFPSVAPGASQSLLNQAPPNLSFTSLPSIGSSQPVQQLSFTSLPPPPIPSQSLSGVDYLLPPPSMEHASTSIPIQLPDFSRPPPIFGSQPAQTIMFQHQQPWNEAQHFPVDNLEPVRVSLTSLVEIKTSGNFMPTIRPNSTREGLPNFNLGMY